MKTNKTLMITVLAITTLLSVSACGRQADGKPPTTRGTCIKGVNTNIAAYALSPAIPNGSLVQCRGVK